MMNAVSASGGESPKKKAEKPFFTWDLLWTGFWYKSIRTPENDLPGTEELFSGGTLYNRGDINLGLPGAELYFRFLATDKRLLPRQNFAL